MKTINYVYWKIVNHYYLLHKLSVLYFYCFDSEFRNFAKLYRACCRVERQDEYRVYVEYTIKPIYEAVRDLSKYIMDMSELIKAIQPAHTETGKDVGR